MRQFENFNQSYFSGVVIPMLTPVTTTGELDEPAVERLIEHIIEGGVRGIFVLGTTGEAASVPPLMKKRLVEKTVNQVMGRVQVYAGISDNSFSTTVEAAKSFSSLGTDIVVAHLPICYELNPSEQENYFKVLSENINVPLMIYNIPATTRMSIPVDVISRLSKIANIVGMKDSQGDINRLTEIIEAVEDRSKFAILNGSTPLTYRSLEIGCDGIVPSLGNIVPGICQSLYDAFLSEDEETADICQSQLNHLSLFMRTGLSLGQSLAAHKTLLSAIQICNPSVLLPLIDLPEQKQNSIKATFLEWLPTTVKSRQSVT